MKFGKQLLQEAVQEWFQEYMSYNTLKRSIKKTKIACTHNGVVSRRVVDARYVDAIDYEDQKRRFMEVIHADLSKIGLFYFNKLAEIKKVVADAFSLRRLTLTHVPDDNVFVVLQSDAEDESLLEQTSRVIACEKELLEAYRLVDNLKNYQWMNKEGLRKIIKKWDKQLCDSLSIEFMSTLNQESWVQNKECDTIMEKLVDTYDQISVGGKSLASELAKISSKKLQAPIKYVFKTVPILIAVIALLLLLFLPIFKPAQIRAQRCLAMLVFVTILWVTEGIPFFVTSLCIPVLTVLLRIPSQVVDGEPLVEALSAVEAVEVALQPVFNHTLALVLGGFAVSAAFSKFQFELAIVSYVQRKLGHRPYLFLLAFLFISWFLSMWVSNVAGAVLSVSLILPVIRDFPTNSRYVRACLIGLALSCNIGGMISPIASPQNAIAISLLAEAHPEQEISFGAWCLVAFPFCLVALFILWIYLIFVMKPTDIVRIPPIIYSRKKVVAAHYIVLFVSAVTILLWCTLNDTRSFLGDMGIVALLPLVTFLGLGILTKQDFISFSWDLVFLIGGGNVLGFAVKNSRLLHIISSPLASFTDEQPEWVALLAFACFTLLITSVVSHTVGAMIIVPVAIEVAQTIGNMRVLVMTTALMCSGSMALPMSSFPNVNSLLTVDDFDRPYLRVKDFLLHGGAISLLTLLLLLSWGYLLLTSIL